MTRVLMFGWEYPPFVAGGLATATVGLVKGLALNEIDVTLVVPFAVPDDAAEAAGVRLIGASSARGTPRTFQVTTPLIAYTTVSEHAGTVATLERRAPEIKGLYGRDLLAEVDRYASVAGTIAGREPHDVIDAHDWMTFPAGIEARRISGRPLVVHIHATEYDRLGEHADPTIIERERAGLEAADRVVANSHAIARICVERFGIAAEKIVVVHWGIDPDGLPDPGPARNPLVVDGSAPPTVLFLGRVTRQKGPDGFIAAAAGIAEQVPAARFVLAGTGDMLPWVMERAAELGLAERVFFTGGVGPAEAAHLYRMADVCVMPSLSEPFGLVALESLRLGTPVLVPRSSGVAEAVANAVLIDAEDIDEIVAAVVSLLEEPGRRAALAERGAAELRQPRFGLAEPARLTGTAYDAAIAASAEAA